MYDVYDNDFDKAFDEAVDEVQKGYDRGFAEGYAKGKAEAEPIKHGHWIYLRDEDNNGLYECSECHKGDIHAKECNVSYCWNCGARMDEVEQ